MICGSMKADKIKCLVPLYACLHTLINHQDREPVKELTRPTRTEIRTKFFERRQVNKGFHQC